ncbi:MAG: hypothetical protein Q7R93_05360 [bacterium]|nr:hypothetical protein [bacterium]
MEAFTKTYIEIPFRFFSFSFGNVIQYPDFILQRTLMIRFCNVVGHGGRRAT